MRQRKPSVLTIDRFEKSDEKDRVTDGQRLFGGIRRGYHELRQDVKRIGEGTEVIKVDNFSLRELIQRSGTKRGLHMKAKERKNILEEFPKSKLLKLEYKEGTRIVHLIDRDKIHFATVVPCTSQVTADAIKDVSTQASSWPSKASKPIEKELVQRGRRFQVAHAKLEGPGQAHPRNAKGKLSLFYCKEYVDNLEHWKKFLGSEGVRRVRDHLTHWFLRSFPDHAKLYLQVCNLPLFANTEGSDYGAFLFGNFSSMALNIESKQTTMLPHRDVSDVVNNLCAITPFGNFKRGSGNLVLWEARVEVPLGPGDAIFFPSGLITHFNTALQPGETRGSIVAFTHASILAWVGHGYKTKKESSKEEVERYDQECMDRWDLFQTLGDKGRVRENKRKAEEMERD